MVISYTSVTIFITSILAMSFSKYRANSMIPKVRSSDGGCANSRVDEAEYRLKEIPVPAITSRVIYEPFEKYLISEYWCRDPLSKSKLQPGVRYEDGPYYLPFDTGYKMLIIKDVLIDNDKRERTWRTEVSDRAYCIKLGNHLSADPPDSWTEVQYSSRCIDFPRPYRDHLLIAWVTNDIDLGGWQGKRENIIQVAFLDLIHGGGNSVRDWNTFGNSSAAILRPRVSQLSATWKACIRGEDYSWDAVRLHVATYNLTLDDPDR